MRREKTAGAAKRRMAFQYAAGGSSSEPEAPGSMERNARFELTVHSFFAYNGNGKWT